MVLNLEEDSVGVAILGADTEIKEGDTVTRTGTIASVPVGEGVVERIVEERRKTGPFINFRDFVDRVDLSVLNKRTRS